MAVYTAWAKWIYKNIKGIKLKTMSIYTERRKKGNIWVDIKLKYGYILSFMSFIVAVVLVFCGLFIPPAGTISAGVLTATGEFLSLCAVAAGYDAYFTHKAHNLEHRVEQMLNNNNTDAE